MLRIVLPFIFVCGVLFTSTHAQQSDPKIASHFEIKCFNHSRSPNAYNKLKSDIDDFMSYLQKVFTDLVPADMKTFCERERNQMKARIADVTNDLKPCLSRSEQFLPDFLHTSLDEAVHFLCHKDAKYTKRFYDDACHKNVMDAQNSDLSTCFDKIFPPRSGSITRNELCSDITTAKECFKRSLDKSCPNNKNLQELNEKFFEYVSEPCSACSQYLNNMLLMFSMIACYLFSRSK